jgi:hypothetical protein
MPPTTPSRDFNPTTEDEEYRRMTIHRDGSAALSLESLDRVVGGLGVWDDQSGLSGAVGNGGFAVDNSVHVAPLPEAFDPMFTHVPFNDVPQEPDCQMPPPAPDGPDCEMPPPVPDGPVDDTGLLPSPDDPLQQGEGGVVGDTSTGETGGACEFENVPHENPDGALDPPADGVVTDLAAGEAPELPLVDATITNADSGADTTITGQALDLTSDQLGALSNVPGLANDELTIVPGELESFEFVQGHDTDLLPPPPEPELSLVPNPHLWDSIDGTSS